MADTLLDMEKLDKLLSLEERLRLHPNLKNILSIVSYELKEADDNCAKEVEARKKVEEEKAKAKAKEEGEARLKAEAEAKAKAEADAQKAEAEAAAAKAKEPAHA